MMRHRRLVAILLVCLAAAGCNSANYRTPERYDQGLVLVLDGAGGITAAPQQICQGLNDGGVRYALEVFHWSAGHNVLADQLDLARNREVGARLAARVLSYMSHRPRRPVHVIGLSAGTGIVVFALEQLPNGCAVDSVCLLASSINSNYNLTPAMSHVRHQIVNFSSVADVVILGLGVGLAGTVDRGQGVPAGIGGFSLPERAPESLKELYQDKLVEMPWNPLYMIYGHLGDHLGATNPAFVKQFMAPIIRDPQWRQHAGGKSPASSKAAAPAKTEKGRKKPAGTKAGPANGQEPKNAQVTPAPPQSADDLTPQTDGDDYDDISP